MKLLNRRSLASEAQNEIIKSSYCLTKFMKLCNICHKISATGQDHLDCIQQRNILLEDQDFKNNIPEKLNLSN
jgi:hypothetical protein